MKILSFITIIFIIIYVLLNSKLPLIFRFSNALFIIGLIYLCIAFAIYVRNLGFFKCFSYFKYKKQVKRLGKDFILQNDLEEENLEDNPGNPLSFYDFYVKRYSNQWSNLIFYKFSIPLLIASFIIAFLCNNM